VGRTVEIDPGTRQVLFRATSALPVAGRVE